MASSNSTPLFFMSSNETPRVVKPDPKPDPNPRPRPRKGGKTQKGPKKDPQRGMGVEKLELEIWRKDGSSPTPKILANKILATQNLNNDNKNLNNNNNNLINNQQMYGQYYYNQQHYHQVGVVAPLAGVPVRPHPVALTHYYLSGQTGPSTIQALSTGQEAAAAAEVRYSAAELPSMPNLSLQEGTYLHHPTNTSTTTSTSTIAFSYKKKKVNDDDNGDQVVGFEQGKDKHHQNLPYNYQFDGFDHNINNNGGGISDNQGFAAVNYNYGSYNLKSKVVATHKNWNPSNMMIEYGFFPGTTDNNSRKTSSKDEDNDDNNNYYYDCKMNMPKELELNLRCSDSSTFSSPSPSSSLSSLNTAATTTTTTTNSDTSIDLSLKLSF